MGKSRSPLDSIDMKEGVGKWQKSQAERCYGVSARIGINETGSSITPKTGGYKNPYEQVICSLQAGGKGEKNLRGRGDILLSPMFRARCDIMELLSTVNS